MMPVSGHRIQTPALGDTYASSKCPFVLLAWLLHLGSIDDRKGGAPPRFPAAFVFFRGVLLLTCLPGPLSGVASDCLPEFSYLCSGRTLGPLKAIQTSAWGSSQPVWIHTQIPCTRYVTFSSHVSSIHRRAAGRPQLNDYQAIGPFLQKLDNYLSK